MGRFAVVPTGDRLLDARSNERLSWHRVVEAMRDLTSVPAEGADLHRLRYERAKAAWWRAFLRLDQVRA